MVFKEVNCGGCVSLNATSRACVGLVLISFRNRLPPVVHLSRFAHDNVGIVLKLRLRAGAGGFHLASRHFLSLRSPQNPTMIVKELDKRVNHRMRGLARSVQIIHQVAFGILASIRNAITNALDRQKRINAIRKLRLRSGAGGALLQSCKHFSLNKVISTICFRCDFAVSGRSLAGKPSIGNGVPFARMLSLRHCAKFNNQIFVRS